MKPAVLRQDLVYPELSYQLVGCAYEVFNELGFGFHEKYYQRAYAIALKNKNILFTEQLYHKLEFQDKLIGKAFFDFFVEEKVVMELKKDNRFSKQHVDQVLEYIKRKDLKLALLFNFTRNGVVYKRFINVNQPNSNQSTNQSDS